MPYADAEVKREHMREWRKEMIAKGYGKWLYARRKLVYTDAGRFRTALEQIVHAGQSPHFHDEEARNEMIGRAMEALRESRDAEEALGPFDPADYQI